MKALAQHVTQLGEGEDFENGAGKWVRQGNHEGGKLVGVDAAEFFKVMKFDEPRESWFDEEE